MKDKKNNDEQTKVINKEENGLELLKDELKIKDQTIQDHINDLKRLQADFENYIKRSEKDNVEFSKYANSNLIIKLLGIIDDFERAFETMKEDENARGISMILNQLNKVLEEEGIRPIITRGEKFDPYKHEVISHIETDDHEEGIIVQEFQKGYWYKDKVIRSSKVIISKKPNLEVNKNE